MTTSNPEPSGLATTLQFVHLVKQEEGCTAHQADLYTIAASLLGLGETIRQRHVADEPISHLGLLMGLCDLLNFITERLNATIEEQGQVSDGI